MLVPVKATAADLFIHLMVALINNSVELPIANEKELACIYIQVR
jgi:hypothetical protein